MRARTTARAVIERRLNTVATDEQRVADLAVLSLAALLYGSRTQGSVDLIYSDPSASVLVSPDRTVSPEWIEWASHIKQSWPSSPYASLGDELRTILHRGPEGLFSPTVDYGVGDEISWRIGSEGDSLIRLGVTETNTSMLRSVEARKIVASTVRPIVDLQVMQYAGFSIDVMTMGVADSDPLMYGPLALHQVLHVADLYAELHGTPFALGVARG
jgi:hypothetical protein